MKHITFYQTGEIDIYDFEDLIRAWVYDFGAESVERIGQNRMLILTDSEEFH